MKAPGNTEQLSTKHNENATFDDHSKMHNNDYSDLASLESIGDQAQMLIKALNDFMIPIIQARVGATSAVIGENKDNSQTSLGPEAKGFILALQRLILATMGSETEDAKADAGVLCLQDSVTFLDKHTVPGRYTQMPISTENSREIADKGVRSRTTEDSETKPSEEAMGEKHASGGQATTTMTIGISYTKLNGGPDLHPEGSPLSIYSYNLNGTDEHSMILANSLDVLRQHVFNKMPIRLLCFQAHGPNKFSLFEKDEIFTHLATKVRAQFADRQFLANIQMLHSIAFKTGGNKYEYSIEQWISSIAKYAILSHTWIHAAPGEVTYKSWNKKNFAASEPGYEKLLNFCKIAERDHGVTLGWMDTICINKESSSELDESIRSMFKWYRDASICVTYLSQTETLSDMPNDPWFTRGWTLQELLAPSRFKFYTAHWEMLVSGNNDKDDPLIHEQIQTATLITPEEFRNFLPEDVTAGGRVYEKFGYSGISRRMQWAARRQVTREEDHAYSLMGIFNVSMSIAYGEGAERAFLRLLKKILASSTYNSDAFNWAGDRQVASMSTFRNPSSLLPTRLQDYLQRADVPLGQGWTVEPTLFSHLGLRIQVLLAPAIKVAHPEAGYRATGDYSCTVDLSCVDQDVSKLYDGSYNLLHEDLSVSFSRRRNQQALLTFGVLNFLEGDSSVGLHIRSIAVALYCKEPPGMVSAQGRPKRIHTKKPIICVFENKKDSGLKNNILKGDLAKHGFQLTTLYL